MAVLEKIRERPVLTLALIGIGILAFVVDPETLMKQFNSNSSTEKNKFLLKSLAKFY